MNEDQNEIFDFSTGSVEDIVDMLNNYIMATRGRIMVEQMKGYKHLSEEEGKKKADNISAQEVQLEIASIHFDAFLRQQKTFAAYMKSKGRTVSKQNEQDARETLQNIKSSLPSLLQMVPTK